MPLGTRIGSGDVLFPNPPKVPFGRRGGFGLRAAAMDTCPSGGSRNPKVLHPPLSGAGVQVMATPVRALDPSEDLDPRLTAHHQLAGYQLAAKERDYRGPKGRRQVLLHKDLPPETRTPSRQ